MTIAKKLPIAEEAFDPTLFGFDTSFNGKSKHGRHTSDKDYILFTTNGKKTKARANLSLSPSTAEFVLDLIGERVDFAIDKKGRILLYAGQSRCVARNNKEGCIRRTISIGVATKKLQEIHGDVHKLLLTPTLFAKGEAILFTPIGEVE